jgi:hypothetical protein
VVLSYTFLHKHEDYLQYSTVRDLSFYRTSKKKAGDLQRRISMTQFLKGLSHDTTVDTTVDRPESRMIGQAFVSTRISDDRRRFQLKFNQFNPWIPHAKRYIGLTYPL